ncbi:MAG TPA: hypothetical protein VJ225_04660 [Nitrososphaeraceae archaeon]|nr:hypothetical protein [Nitrososphaeraceae archaeon]
MCSLCALPLRQTNVNTGFPGFKRILVAYDGMSVVICDVDDSPLTSPVSWQFAFCLLHTKIIISYAIMITISSFHKN